MQGDITVNSDGGSSAGIGAGNGGFYSGTIRADDIAGVDTGGYATANLYAEKAVQSFSGADSYFSGTVHTPVLRGGISGYVDASITITEGNSFYVYDGGCFTGHVEMYPQTTYSEGPYGTPVPDPCTACVTADTDVTVHHPTIGAYNTLSLGDQDVYYHFSSPCYYPNHPEVVVTDNIYDALDGAGDYECAIRTESADMGDPDTMDDGWEGIFDPETEQYTPDRGNMSYTLQAVDANGNGMGGVWFHLNGDIYHADENGCLELQCGPGVISPLVITDRDDSGGNTILRKIKSFYPVPDRVNKIQVSDALNISFLMNDQDAPGGNLGRMGGFTFDILGHEVRIFDLPMELDLNFDTDAIQVSVTYNSDTGLYDVVLGTAASKDALPSLEETLNALAKEILPFSNTSKSKNKVKLVGLEWTYEALGAFSIEWDGKSTDFVVHNSKVMVQFGGEGRFSSQLPPPVTMFYGTAALSGSIAGTGQVDMSPQTLAEQATAQLFATVEPQILLESAIGVGSRYVDVYAELGAGGQLAGEVKFPMKDPYADISVVGSIDMFGEIRALVFGQKVSKTLAEVQLWPVKKAAEATALAAPEEMELLPRDYASGYELTRAASGDGPRYYTAPGDGAAAYPYMDLQLWMLPNNRYLLVWTDDDLSRGDADRSVLRAAIGEYGDKGFVWGESVAVDDDATADLFFDVCVSGDYAALVWQDLDDTFGDGADATTAGVAEAVELNAAVLDCTGDVPVAGGITTLSTGDGVYESLPTVHYKNGTLRVAWVTSTVADPLYTGEEEYTLWLYDGIAAAVTTTEAAIDGIAFTDRELLWTQKAQDHSALWLRNSSGALSEECSDGVTGLQSRGSWFCWNEQGTLFRGNGSFARYSAAASGLAPDAVVQLNSSGGLFQIGRTGETSTVFQLDSDGNPEPVFQESGYVSAWAAEGGSCGGAGENQPRRE